MALEKWAQLGMLPHITPIVPDVNPDIGGMASDDGHPITAKQAFMLQQAFIDAGFKVDSTSVLNSVVIGDDSSDEDRGFVIDIIEDDPELYSFSIRWFVV